MLAHRSPWAVAFVGLIVVGVAAILAVSIGTVAISPTETLKVLGDRIMPVDFATSSIADPIIWNIRLPRVVAALGAGAALGLAGVVLQGLFRNPVADPQLVGLSSIASVGVLIGALACWNLWGPIAGVVGGAVVGALGSSLISVFSSKTGGEPSHFILVGIGFGLAVTALVAAATIAIHDPRIPDVSFWFVGGLSGATWGTALWVCAFSGIVLVAVLPFARALDTMSLGHSAARHLGINVRVVGATTLTLVGLGVGGAVGAAGVVAFVGLIGAHVARSFVGAHHKRLLIGGAAVGATFLILADGIGRLVGGRFEVPVGLITAAIGGPYLVWLIVSKRVVK